MAGFDEVAATAANRIVFEKLPVKRKFPYAVLHGAAFGGKRIVSIEIARRFERRGPEHVRWVVHPADEIRIIATAPFDENPAFEIFQKSVPVLEALEEIHDSENLALRQFGHC